MFSKTNSPLVRGLLIATIFAQSVFAADLHHYVFFNRDHEKIGDKSFLENPAFEGAQLKFTWRELEPKKDQYDFSGIQTSASFLKNGTEYVIIHVSPPPASK